MINLLMKEFTNTFCFSVSHTSRKERPGEVDGVNYHYISKDKFKEMLEAGDFIEHNVYNENYYGTAKSQLEDLQKKGKVQFI